MAGFIKLRVKSLWEGKVGIRDRYVEDAKKRNIGIRIIHKERIMTIPADKVQESIVSTSKELFWDKFKGSAHHLVYFKWQPNDGEQLMLGL